MANPVTDLGKCYRQGCKEPAVVFVGIADPDTNRYPACPLHARSYQRMMPLIAMVICENGEASERELERMRKIADKLAAEDIANGWKVPES